MEVRHLQAFVAVADELHFGRAAERLRLSPSPVSRTVMELERELGTALFVRSHHEVRLTRAGEALLPRGRELLDAWRGFVSEGRRAGAEVARAIVVGSPSLAPTTLLDAVLRELEALLPAREVRVEFASSAELVKALRRGELDLAVVHLPLDGTDLVAVPLAGYESSVVVREDDELARGTSVLPEDLAGRRVLLPTLALQPAAMARTHRWLADQGAVVEGLADADLVRVAQLVGRGRGITLTTAAGVARQVFAQPGLVVLPLVGEGPGVQLGLAWCAGTSAAPVAARVAERITREPLEGVPRPSLA